MMARELIILLLAFAMILTSSISSYNASFPLTHSIEEGGHVEIVKNGAGRVYPVSDVSIQASDGDRLIYADDGEVLTGRMSGGKLILFGMPININEASAVDITAIPGIGPATAKAIVRYREKAGSFRSVDDLISVKGIGEKRLEKIREYIMLV